MFSLGHYAVAGVALLLAFEYVAPADASFAYRDAVESASLYQVNRAEKGDRLSLPKSASEKSAPVRSPKIPVGCDAAFSNLSAHARLNFASRCVA